jgi:4-amino-4-deoxy-L-arabinose transferase-like glycosyltransferase
MSRLAAAAWDLFRRYPLTIAALLIAVQCLPALEARWFWFSDEVRYAEVYSNLVEGGHWIVLNLNGVPYPDKPPLFFLMLAALDLIPGVGMPGVMFLGSAVSGWFLLFAVTRLGAALGLSRDAQAAGVAATLCLFGVILHLHYVRMDLLFVALMLWAQALMLRYHLHGARRRTLLAGYALGGLAVLVKGPLGLLLPMAAAFTVALWAGRWRPIASVATVAGLGVAVVVMSSWALGIVLVEGWGFFSDQIIGQQIVARATDAFHHAEPWHFYFGVLPVLMLPWTGMVAALPWRRAARVLPDLRASLGAPGPVAALALGALVHFAIMSALDGKVAVYLLPVMAQLALLTGALAVSHDLRAGWIGTGVMAVLSGAALIVLAALPEGAGLRMGAILCGGLLVLTGAGLILRGRAGGPALAGLTFALTGWSLALALVLLPGLNERASTRIPAELLADYAGQGHTPVAYRTYPGIYSYYAGRDILQIDDPESLLALVAEGGPLVIAARRARLGGLDLEGFEIIDDRAIQGAGSDYLVLVRPGPDG